MWFKVFFMVFFISVFIRESALAQQIPVKTDTTHIYDNIESYSKQNKITNFVYGLIFEPHQAMPETKKIIQNSYSAFEGKIIRQINVVTLDPFCYSISDTTAKPNNFILKTGNELHIKSSKATIRNFLLIHQNQKFDSLLVKESERLVRSRNFVRDVSFSVASPSENSDSVDIYVRELDNWSLVPEFNSSSSRNTINFAEQNIIGSGNEFSAGYVRYSDNMPNTFNTSFFIPNIRNTYISSTLNYSVCEDKTFNKSFTVNRPFYSSLTKWAGGVSLDCQLKKVTMVDGSSVNTPLNLKFQNQDYWAGYACQIFKGNTVNERTTNLITTARYLRVHYLEKPSGYYDPLNYYSNEDFYLAGIGLSTRKYVRDKYIFKYGVPEDVPIGRVYALVGGYQIRNNIERTFLGGRFSVGNYYPWGYLSSNIEYESFFHTSRAEEGIFNANVKYFTKLIEINRWKFRQFVEPQITIGINRFSYDSLTLNDGFGIDGFKSTKLSGTSRLLLSLQTQAYAPWNLLGFRFGPFFNYTLGMLGNAKTGFKGNSVYSHIGFGVLIKNEHLILNTFQLSISFYPMIPGDGRDIYKVNSFETNDFGLSDFEIGKPAPTVFQ